jgi:carbon starvation protein CstA
MFHHERIPGNDHITSCTLWYVFSVANQLRLSCFYMPSLVWVIRLPHSSVSFRISLPLIPTVTFGITSLLFLSLMRGR